MIAAFLITFFGGLSVQGIRPLYWIQFAGQCVVFLFVYLSMVEVDRPEMVRRKSRFFEDFLEVFERGTGLKRWIIFSTLGMFIMSMVSPFRAPFAHEVKGANQFIIGGMASAARARRPVRTSNSILFPSKESQNVGKLGENETY